MATPARRASSRLSLSRKFSQSASKAGSRASSVKSAGDDTTKFINELKDNPFKVTKLTLDQEDDLLSAAPDALSLTSRESPELKHPVIPTIPECIELSSESESEMPKTPPKKQQQQDQNFNFFTPARSRKKHPATVASSSGLGVSTLKSTTRKTVSSSKTNATAGRDSSKVKKVRRQICKSSNIKMLTSKYFDDSQKRITGFFQKKEEGDGSRFGYHTVIKRSLMPAINTGDENLEDFLAVEVTEGTQPLRPSQIEGPQRSQQPGDDPQKILERIEAAQSACIDDRVEAINMEEDQVAMAIPCDEPDLDSGISTTTSRKPPAKTPAAKRKSTVATTAKSTAKRRPRGPIIVPKYKIVAGTTFAVDAFRYGDIAGVTHYFLSHFHADHYIGLKKSFDKPLIMSPITASLVAAFINVDRVHYILLDLHETIVLDGVRITALDANHCPGAVLFLFQLPTGTNLLHTGDFRASPAMEEYPEFWNMDIHTLYLDTTYLSTKYCFKDQWESVSDAVREVKTFLGRNIGRNVLIVCGSYLVGKEKVWLELAARTGFRVWTEPNRRKAVDAVAVECPLQTRGVIVDDPRDAQIHVLSMGKLAYDELVAYMDEHPERECVLALRPSGWEKNSRPQYRGRINIVGIEYSEHSSYDELRRFVRFLRPREVISTVPYGNTNLNRTPQVPTSWYQGPIRPEKPPLQTAITSYFKVGGGEKGAKGEDEEGGAKKEGSEPKETLPEDTPTKAAEKVEPVKDDYTIVDSDSDWM
ncbi:DNA cross-link repair 1A protein [Culex quinquefasciatus]|uniref:DNA cross-link repair 1A protein n=1 Tax=Culex quinquefasciatus TaxID=7176 RepID=UPI0018E2EADE|nr:DNA cross-link repair 1A protein [Culex quinquefasciatus]